MSVEVLAVNDTPIAYHRTEKIKVNKSLNATLTGTDADSDPLTFSISKEPEHGKLTFDSNFNTSGKLIYIPEPYFEGQDAFSFKLNDGRLDSTPATVSINVTPNLLPVADSLPVATPEDTPVQIRLTGSDRDLDPLSYIIVSEPSHGRLKGSVPNFTYTPNKNFNGSDSFSFKVNDSIDDSTPATVSITISSINDPPVANDDTVVTREDIPAIKINVLANDTDIDNEGRYLYLDTFSVTAVTQGKNGSVYINPDDSLSYSPNTNFFGNDEFTYTVSDNKGDTDTAKVTVTVNMANDSPFITSAPVTTATVGALYTYDVNAIDPDLTDKLTYSLTTKPADMTIDPDTGLIQWTTTELGENEVEVMVADSNSIPTTGTQSFTITVNPPPPKKATLTPRDGYYHRNRKTLSADGKAELVRASDDKRFVTSYSSYSSYDFSNVSVPAGVLITSVVLYVEHFEEERFASGKLEWAVGTGWPRRPVVWASIQAPINEQESYESVDSWDITSLVDTRDKLNSLQLQIKNNDLVGRKQTMIDYIYLVVEWD
ncbi:MAG: Ig-like domain-containing protein [Planctomycetota bacterium]